MSSTDPYLPYGRQTITEADIAAVSEVLRSPFLTQGPAVPSFERSIAEKIGCNFAIAVNSATSALHIACLAPWPRSRRLALDLSDYFCSFRKLCALLRRSG